LFFQAQKEGPTMMRVSLLVLALVLGWASAAPTQDGAKKDQEAVQGAWKVVKFTVAGKDQADDLLKKLRVTIEGDKFTMKLADGVIGEAQFKLDPSKSPRQIDMVNLSGPEKGQVRLGIYEIDGNTWKACFLLNDAAKKRPANFEPVAGTLSSILVLERSKE
jgi:uncharacterized protein (TIGR03067 family)